MAHHILLKCKGIFINKVSVVSKIRVAWCNVLIDIPRVYQIGTTVSAQIKYSRENNKHL